MKVRIAVAPGGAGFDAGGFAEFVQAAERLGFDTIWLSDVPMAEVVDPLVGLTFAAGRTTRLKLGANVVPIGRNPMLLAKELAQLDQLSNGRLLLSLVPGLDQPGERQALGIGRANRGAYLDEVMPLLRQWWAGETVTHASERFGFDFDAVPVRPRPVQDPLELWLGGKGPQALARVGRLADGWLGAAVVPDEVPAAIGAIEKAAADAGRAIDPEHFGLSIPYARRQPDERTVAALRARRRDDAPVEELLPVGGAALRNLLGRHTDAGLSKFVLRPVDPADGLAAEMEWLAETVLDLQT